MKTFCLIFIVHMLALISQPCDELYSLATESAVNGGNSTVIVSSEHGEEATENCSPFCACGCCSIPVVQSEITFAITPVPVGEVAFELQSAYQSPHPSTYSDSIWQPPKA